jgi:hypothetical protein
MKIFPTCPSGVSARITTRAFASLIFLALWGLVACRSNSYNYEPATKMIMTASPNHPTQTLIPAFIGTASVTTISPEDATLKWLNGIPCSAPCWEEVTPGETTHLEAIKIWSSNHLFSKLEDIHRSSKNGAFDFEMNISFDHFMGSAGFSLPSQPEIIDWIVLSGSYEVTLNDLIKAYGQPSHIIAGNYSYADISNCWFLNIIWLSKGLAFLDEGIAPFPMIADNLSLETISFFSPGLDGFKKAGLNYNAQGDEYSLASWHGYDSFDNYVMATPTP